MHVSPFFASDYVSARTLFVGSCVAHNHPIQSRKHPSASGPNGEELFMDVLRIGPKNAKGVLFITSGTHGTEGLTGSGVQVALLHDEIVRNLPEGVAIVLVHAVNPYGFAHLTRTNEDNIDLNRNFIDYSKPPRANPKYDTIHPWIVPQDWFGESRKNADQAIADFIQSHGERNLQTILLQGQYTQPEGLFYGGDARSWSYYQFSDIVKTEGTGADHLAIIDIHTGIGPEGFGEPIYVGVEQGFSQARNWYGDDVTNAGKGKSHASEFNGPIVTALWTEHPNANHTAIVLEFGTRPLTDVLAALRADNWLRQHPNTDDKLYNTIKRDLRDALYVDEDNWRQMIWDRSRQLIEGGINGLGQFSRR
jgi:hypothetical protein